MILPTIPHFNKYTQPTIELVLSLLAAAYEDEAYLEKIKTSPRDTVNLIAPIILTKDHPSIIQSHQIIYSSEGELA